MEALHEGDRATQGLPQPATDVTGEVGERQVLGTREEGLHERDADQATRVRVHHQLRAHGDADRLVLKHGRPRHDADEPHDRPSGVRVDQRRNRLVAPRVTKEDLLEISAQIIGARTLAVPKRLARSEEHTSELQSLAYLVCRLLLEKKKNKILWKRD